MDCKDFENNIPVFLEEKMNSKQAKEFFAHMDECESCKEELRIQYLISEGTLRLEEGDSFDLNKELDIKLEKTKKKLKGQKITNLIIYAMEAVAIAAVIFILILVFTAR